MRWKAIDLLARYTTGATSEEADAKLMGALSELKLLPETSMKDVQ
jgi:hypothetical protein